MTENRVLIELNDEDSNDCKYLVDKIPIYRPQSSVDDGFSMPSLKDLASRARKLPTNPDITDFTASQALAYVNDVLVQIDECLKMAKILLAELESEDDVELFYEGREGVDEVNKVVSSTGHLMTQLMNTLDSIKEAQKDTLFKEKSLLLVANRMEEAIHAWNSIALTTKDIKQQVRIALEWKEIYQQILTGVESELNQCFSLIFTIEEKNHLVELNGIDLSLLETALSGTPYRGKKKLPAGLSDNDMNLMFLNLTSRLTPLGASFDILRIKVTNYIQEAKEIFPSSIKSITAKQTHLEGEWRRLLTEVESVETELVDNRWNQVFRKACKQIFEKLDSLKKSIESIKQENQQKNPDKARIERANIVNLKLIQNITKSIALVDKATSDQLIQNPEIYAMQSSLHKKWASISEEASKYSAMEMHAKKPSGGTFYESSTGLLPLQTGKSLGEWRQSHLVQMAKKRTVLPINPPSPQKPYDEEPQTPIVLSSPTDSPITSPDESPTPAPKSFKKGISTPRPRVYSLVESERKKRVIMPPKPLSPENIFKGIDKPPSRSVSNESDESESIPLSQLAGKSYLLGTKSSQAKIQSPSPVKRSSPSPMRKLSESPMRRPSEPPLRRLSESPARRPSESPVWKPSPSPLRKSSVGPLSLPKRSISSTRKSSLPVARRPSSQLSKPTNGISNGQIPNFTPLSPPTNSSIPILTSPRTSSRPSSRQQESRIPSLIPKAIRKTSITPNCNRRIVSGPADLRPKLGLSAYKEEITSPSSMPRYAPMKHINTTNQDAEKLQVEKLRNRYKEHTSPVLNQLNRYKSRQSEMKTSADGSTMISTGWSN